VCGGESESSGEPHHEYDATGEPVGDYGGGEAEIRGMGCFDGGSGADGIRAGHDSAVYGERFERSVSGIDFQSGASNRFDGKYGAGGGASDGPADSGWADYVFP